MGFVKISDELTSWAWINDPKTVYIYVRLLLGAAWAETDFRNIHLQRGQIAISQRDFAEKCGVTYQELRTILNRLITTQKITQSTTHKISVITLIEYDCDTQPLTQSSTTYQRDNNAIATQCQRDSNAIATQYQRDSNAASLFKSNNQIIREQNTRARASGFNEIKQLFNSICVSLPPLEYDLTMQQVHLLEQAQINLHGISFEDFFTRIEKSDFLCGRTGGNFTADFNWIMRPENMQKILSGNFDRNYTQAAQKNTPVKNPWDGMTDEDVARMEAEFYE